MRRSCIVRPFPVVCGALLSAEAGLMHAEMCRGVLRLSEINGHVEILIENGKMVFSVGGRVPVLSMEGDKAQYPVNQQIVAVEPVESKNHGARRVK